MIKYFFYFIVFISIVGCNGCSRSGKYRSRNTNETIRSKQFDDDKNDEDNNDSQFENRNNKHLKKTSIEKIGFGSNEIRMVKESGIYKIPIVVNGVTMFTIFDTGASLISISNTEALFLYKQGTLTESDFEGSINFQDATGKISTGTIINLKEVQIGNVILKNVKASVVDNNNAPILLGQSALSKFGKISIDYEKGILIFEK